MFEQLRENWLSFRREAPGRRFAQRYVRRSEGDRASPLRRTLLLLAGALLGVVGLFFLAVPGPGLIPLALGGALMARESLMVARLLDRVELRVRRWLGR